jgi:hypothetical protein
MLFGQHSVTKKFTLTLDIGIFGLWPVGRQNASPAGSDEPLTENLFQGRGQRFFSL